MKIVEFKCQNKNYNDFYVCRKNNVYIENVEMLFQFYQMFLRSHQLFVQNLEMTTKDFIFIDFTSVSSILHQMEYTKGTLLYYCINHEIESVPYDNQEKVMSLLQEMIENFIAKTIPQLELSLEDSFQKLLGSIIKVDIENKKLISTILILLKKYLEIENFKTPIILYDSSIVSLNLSSDKAYLFDINPFQNLSDSFLLLTDNIYNVERNHLVCYLQSLWPTSYQEKEIESLINKFFYELHKTSPIILTEEKVYLVAKILEKHYHFTKKFIFRGNVNDNAIKTFLDTF